MSNQDQQQAITKATSAAAYIATLKTEVSRRGMISALNNVAEVLTGARDWQAVDWRTLNAANVAAIMAKIHGAPKTQQKTLSALKGVARAAWRLEQISTETYMRIKDIAGTKGSRLPAGRYIEHGEREALIRTCEADQSAAGARDGALLAVAIQTGMRRDELSGLTMSSLDIERGVIRVLGKGDREREVYLHNGAVMAVRDWLAVRGAEAGAVFCVIGKGERIQPARTMSNQALTLVLIKRAAQAGVNNITWHDLRRTFISDLLDAGVDISTVAELAGHKSNDTTRLYDRRPAETRRAAAGFIAVPYRGRNRGSL